MHRRAIQGMHARPSWRSSGLGLMALLAVIGLMTTPVLAQGDLVDPGLDAIMRAVPAGYQRSANDRLPAGPMTATEFNAASNASVPVLDDHAVFYGATYQKPDGTIILFFGMSTQVLTDGNGFANGAVNGTLPDGKAFLVDMEGARGLEGDSNGVHVVSIALARNGRGFAIISFGAPGRADVATFAKVVADRAQATPARSDVKPAADLLAAVATLTFFALFAIGVIALWRFVRRKRRKNRGVGPTMGSGPYPGPPMSPWGQNAGAGGPVQRPVNVGFPPPPPRS